MRLCICACAATVSIIASSCESGPAATSRAIGAGAGLFSVGIPIAVWYVAMRPWSPKTRIAYAARFALWPLVLVSTMLGGPLVRLIAGIESRYLPGFAPAAGAVVLISAVAAPFAFGIGYAISTRRLELGGFVPSGSMPATGPEADELMPLDYCAGCDAEQPFKEKAGVLRCVECGASQVSA